MDVGVVVALTFTTGAIVALSLWEEHKFQADNKNLCTEGEAIVGDYLSSLENVLPPDSEVTMTFEFNSKEIKPGPLSLSSCGKREMVVTSPSIKRPERLFPRPFPSFPPPVVSFSKPDIVFV